MCCNSLKKTLNVTWNVIFFERQKKLYSLNHFWVFTLWIYKWMSILVLNTLHFFWDQVAHVWFDTFPSFHFFLSFFFLLKHHNLYNIFFGNILGRSINFVVKNSCLTNSMGCLSSAFFDHFFLQAAKKFFVQTFFFCFLKIFLKNV